MAAWIPQQGPESDTRVIPKKTHQVSVKPVEKTQQNPVANLIQFQFVIQLQISLCLQLLTTNM